MGSGSSCSLSFELFDNYLNTKNCCVTDHFNSDFELLPLQTTNINPVKAHFSLPVKLSESLSQFLVSYLSLSDFELLEGRPPIPTRLWPHCVLLSQEDISPALISSFQYRWWTKPILFSVRNIPGNPHISRKNNKERFALLKQKFKGRKEKIKEDGEHEEEENEEGELEEEEEIAEVGMVRNILSVVGTLGWDLEITIFVSTRAAFFVWRAPILSWPRITCSQVRMLTFLEPSREMP